MTPELKTSNAITTQESVKGSLAVEIKNSQELDVNKLTNIERKNVCDFYGLLLKIDRRINPEMYKNITKNNV